MERPEHQRRRRRRRRHTRLPLSTTLLTQLSAETTDFCNYTFRHPRMLSDCFPLFTLFLATSSRMFPIVYIHHKQCVISEQGVPLLSSLVLLHDTLDAKLLPACTKRKKQYVSLGLYSTPSLALHTHQCQIRAARQSSRKRAPSPCRRPHTAACGGSGRWQRWHRWRRDPPWED